MRLRGGQCAGFETPVFIKPLGRPYQFLMAGSLECECNPRVPVVRRLKTLIRRRTQWDTGD